MDQALALCFHGKAFSVMEALVEVLFDLYMYKQTIVTWVYIVLVKITRARSGMTLMFETD